MKNFGHRMLRQARRRDGLPNEPRLLDALCDDFQRYLSISCAPAATEVDDVVDARSPFLRFFALWWCASVGRA